MQTPIQAVLFDYGMVLSGPPDASAWERMKALTHLDEPAFHAAYWAPRHAYDRGDITGPAYWSTVSPASDPATIALLIAADNDLWTQPNPPMLAWAAALQRAQIPTGILSNLGDSMTEGVLSRFDFSAFTHRTWSYTLGIAKPEPAIYAHAIAGLNTDPAHILFIDDRSDNIAAAHCAGIQTLQYTTHPAFEAEMQARNLHHLLNL